MRDYEWELMEQYQAIQEWKKKKELQKKNRQLKFKKFLSALKGR